jgi:hypothetical protein
MKSNIASRKADDPVLAQENHADFLPSGGYHPYITPKDAHGVPARVDSCPLETYADRKGWHWQYVSDRASHWDVRKPHDKSKNNYLRVGFNGNILEVHASSMKAAKQLLLEAGVDSLDSVQFVIE